MSEVKQTKNVGLIVGTLSEKNLEIKDEKFKDKDGKERPCKTVKGEIAVETENGIFRLRVFARDKKIDNTENKTYKGMETICNTYNSKIDESKDSSKTADVISCNIKLNLNDYVGQDGKLKNIMQINMLQATRVNADSPSKTDVDIEGVIRTIKPEIRNEEETGRLTVEFVMVGYGGIAVPITLIVPEDLKDGFEGMYEVGQTCRIYGEIIMKHVGDDNNKKQASFGRKAEVQSGFDVMEIIVVGGEEPYEDEIDDEGNSKVISLDVMKQLMNERDIMLDTLEKEGYKGGSDSKESKKDGKSKGMGTKKPIDDDSIPF